MQKIIIQGPKVSDLTDVNNSPMILEEEKILEHFQKSHSANEIFINSHGNPVTKKQLRADLATSDNMSEKDKETYLLKCFNQSYNPNYTDLLEHPPAHLSVDLFENSLCLINPLLSRIIKNTEGSSSNIVHIFSCHSGAAQHYAHKIDGKFILCTYTSAENTMDMPAAPTLFDKYNQSDNLLDFIIKNLTLVSVMGFSVFYKSDDAAYCLAFNPKDIKTMNSAGIKEFMQAQYKKIAEFQHFDQKHLKIFPEYKLPNIEEYTDNEVKDIITNILNFSITDLTFSQIQDLLKIEGLDIYHALRRVICSKDQEVLELSLRYPNINMKIDNALIGTAIKKADLNTVKRIIKEVTSIGKLIFEDAIDSGKLEIIKVVAEKAVLHRFSF